MRLQLLSALLAGSLVTLFTASPAASQKIKVGVVTHLSGPYAAPGIRFKQGVETYFHNYGNKVAGREIEVVYRDLAGTAPARAKQLTEELIVQEGVSIVGGFYLSPEAVAAGPTLTEAKIPGVAFNAGSSLVNGSSPYFIRPTGSVPQVVSAQAQFAADQGKKNAYILVSDFSAGHEVQDAFKKYFTARGGRIIGEDRAPLNTVDYSPFIERIAAANPDVIELFVPNGAPSVAVTKALRARGLLGKSDVMTIGWGWLDESNLYQYDDSIIGAYNAQIYSASHEGTENKKFKDATKIKFPDILPSYEAASTYDSMHVIAQMIASQQGKTFDGPAAAQAVIGWSFEGARGTQSIEPGRAGRMNVFIERVIKQNGQLRLEPSYQARGVPSVP